MLAYRICSVGSNPTLSAKTRGPLNLISGPLVLLYS
nr:MAG TPA: hypothetical protein [Caudoviricetes sp.]